MTDFEALKVLAKDRFTIDRGVIRYSRKEIELTKDERAAINFLCDEYDYGCEPH